MINNIYKGFYNIVRNESTKEANIFIYGVIGGFDFETWKPINTANNFVKDFEAVESDHDVINVRINSPGGNVWDGLPIYNTLKNSKKHINTYVDGIAYSMASLIALAGDKVYGYANSMLMFHNGSSYSYGNAKQMREDADTLDQYDEALGSIIEEKLNISSEEVKEKYLNFSDNYFVGKKALDIGFFDEIITSKEADVPEDIKNMSPKDLLKHYAALNHTSNTPRTSTKNNSKKHTMSKLNVPLIEAALGETFSQGETEAGILLTDAQATALETLLANNQQAIDNAATAAATAQETITGLETTNTALTTDAEALGNTIQEALETAEVEDAENLSATEGVEALSALVAEYGSKDGGKTTKVKGAAETDNDEDGPQIISGVNLDEALNC